MRAETGQQKRAFCLSRIWGSYHGGTVYSKRLLHELSSRGWAVTVLAERFEEPVSNGIVLKTFFNSSPRCILTLSVGVSSTGGGRLGFSPSLRL
jgi:hypothetical protein